MKTIESMCNCILFDVCCFLKAEVSKVKSSEMKVSERVPAVVPWCYSKHQLGCISLPWDQRNMGSSRKEDTQGSQHRSSRARLCVMLTTEYC